MSDYEQLYSLLSACAAAVKRAADCALAQGATRGLDYDGLLLLKALSDREEMQIQQLAAAVGRDIATTSRQVSLLVARGWLTKRTDARDLRVRYVKLTARALEALKAAEALMRQLYSHMLAHLSAIEQQELVRMLVELLAQKRS